MIPGNRRDSEALRQLISEIRSIKGSRPVRFMEVCGGHTAAIHRYAINNLLPAEIELLSGPGCPVCVTPSDYVDRAVALAALPKVTLATYGDLLRVPGTHGSLADARARGGNVRVVYSASEAVALAEAFPETIVVLLGIGFETTACTVAAAIEQAFRQRLKNFRVLSALKTMPAALRALLSDNEGGIDGLILPGHVMTVTGTTSFEFIASEFRIPCVVTGFEPQDLLEAILRLTRQVESGRADLEIQYGRSVKPSGNATAQRAMDRVFAPSDAEWRGLGNIPGSGLNLRQEFAAIDAEPLVPEIPRGIEDRSCRCGDILRGKLKPAECPLFGKVCTPEQPRGACMVSSEGACAATYQYAAMSDAG